MIIPLLGAKTWQLLLAPLHTRRFHIAPGATGKAHETAVVHLPAQAALAVGAVEW